MGKSKNDKEKKVIVWAVDPYQKFAKQDKIIQELKFWSRQFKCAVQPISMISSLQLDEAQVTEESVAYHLEKELPADFLRPEVYFEATLSNRGLALALTKITRRRDVFMIFANTGRKKTWNPFRLGGFAESLIAHSKVPVLLMNPTCRASSKINNIFFATDFSEASRAALKGTIPLAKSFNAEILLYNQVSWPTVYFAEMAAAGGMPAVDMQPFAEELLKSHHKKAYQWTGMLKTRGLSANSLVLKEKKSLAEDIVAQAQSKKASLIVMASVGTPLEQAVLGSAVRDVVVSSNCPVIVFHKGVRTSSASLRSRPKKISNA